MILAARYPFGRLPLRLPAAFGAVVLAEGTPAWVWKGKAPALSIPSFVVPEDAPAIEGWEVDHVVVTTPSLDRAIAALTDAGAVLRKRAEVAGQPAAFLLAGVLIEVLEVAGASEDALWGLTLGTEEPLEALAARWRQAGLDVSDVRAAVQPGRRIFTVRDQNLAVMDRRRRGGS